MQGWSKFKQGNLEEALTSFFGVLDGKIVGIKDDDLDKSEALTRADKELVDDTLRVIGISLANLKGAESIPAYITSDARRSYEFRVYQQLGQLYLKQERPKDAADTYAGFARLNPLDAQAPAMQAQVIAIDQEAGFDQLALAAKKDYVAQYGLDGEFRKANPEGWEHAQPLVKTALAELAQRYHASAQKTKSQADYVEAAKWYRAWLAEFARDPEAAENNFLLAEVLYESGQFAASAVEYEKTAYEYPAHAHSADAGYAALLAHTAEQKGVTGDALVPLQRTGVDSELRFAAAFPADSRTPAVLTNAADTLFKLHDNDARRERRASRCWRCSRRPRRRSAAWPGRWSRTRRSRPASSTAPRRPTARCWRSRRPTTRRAASSPSASPPRSTSRASRRAPPATTSAAAENFARVAVAAPASGDPRERRVRRRRVADRAEGLGRRRPHAGGLPPALSAATRCRPKSRRDLALAYSEQQQWAPAAAQYERIAAAPTTTPEGADARPRGAVAGRHAVRARGRERSRQRQGRQAAARRRRRQPRARRQGLRPLPEAVPGAAGAGRRGALPPRAARAHRRQRRRRDRADARHLRRRPERRRRAHRPHPHAGRDGRARRGAAGVRGVPEGAAGRAAGQAT